MNTGRIFNEVILASDRMRAYCMDDDEIKVSLEIIRTIFDHFGENITKARINFTSWNTSHQFVSFLNSMPHLKELSLDDVHIADNNWADHDTLNLHKLSALNLIRDHYRIFDFLNILPDGVIQSVELSQAFFDFSTFFLHQYNVKKLKVPDLFDVENFQNVKLHELSIASERLPADPYRESELLLEMLKLQPYLLKLEICDLIEKPIAVHICTKLKQLQSLSISFFDMIEGEEALTALVLNLSNLQHLKELKLRSIDFDIPTLTLVQQPMVTKLFLHIYDPWIEIDATDLMLLKQAFPSLIELGLKNVVPYNIPDVLNVFPDIETLGLRIFSYPQSTADLFEMTNEKAHENLKNFFLSFHHSDFNPIDIQFEKFVSNMSHLEALEIWNPQFFLNDVNGLTKSLKNKLTRLVKLNVFKTDHYGVIHYPEKGSIVSPHMFQ